MSTIPKTIHYCWVGGSPLPESAVKCINSWRKQCPDYKIIEWNESNYDFSKCLYMKQAYEAKKWGFVPDYARLDIIFNHGGIYLDVDVELIKPLDLFLNDKCFFGLETEKTVALGLGFGAERNHPIIHSLMEDYNRFSFINSDGSYNLRPSPAIQTEGLKKFGFLPNGKEQYIEYGCHIYPVEVMNPMSLDTGLVVTTDKTVSIHHYFASWASRKNKRNTRIYQFFARICGKAFADRLKKAYRNIK